MPGARPTPGDLRSRPEARSAAGPDVVRLAVIGRGRGRLHLDASAVAWESTAVQVRAAAAGGLEGTSWVLTGGEPTLWRDLPEAVEALALGGGRPGLSSDGWSLSDPRVARDLASRGLRGVTIQLHASRADAHDWITGISGSARRAVAAVRACRQAGLEVEAEIWLTKPGAAHLAETVGVLARLGARRITVRLLAAAQVDATAALALLPRLVPSVRFLAAAGRVARSAGVTLLGGGFPGCLLSLCQTSGLRAAREVWVVPDGEKAPRVGPAGLGGLSPCDLCGGRIPCDGAPADHVTGFGSLELGVLQARVQAGELP